MGTDLRGGIALTGAIGQIGDHAMQTVPTSRRSDFLFVYNYLNILCPKGSLREKFQKTAVTGIAD